MRVISSSYQNTLVLICFIFINGCFGSNQGRVHDQSFSDDPTLPIVDAYIEYSGTHERWGGPQSFILHILARDSEHAKIFTSPTILKEKFDHHYKSPVFKGMSVEDARKEMNLLKDSLNKKTESIEGCLYPLRLLLIRSDGAVVEKKGCRGQEGWPQDVSRLVEKIFSAIVEKDMERIPASKSKKLK